MPNRYHQDRFLPIANVSRIMKKSVPQNAKIAKDAKECVQVRTVSPPKTHTITTTTTTTTTTAAAATTTTTTTTITTSTSTT